jgi:hypothetical protein
MPWRPKVPSPTWHCFRHSHLTNITAIDMFIVATATFRLLYALIVLGHDRRKIIHFEVTQNPTQVWLSLLARLSELGQKALARAPQKRQWLAQAEIRMPYDFALRNRHGDHRPLGRMLLRCCAPITRGLKITSAAFSAIIYIDVTIRYPGIRGKIDASTTRRLRRPCTRN